MNGKIYYIKQKSKDIKRSDRYSGIFVTSRVLLMFVCENNTGNFSNLFLLKLFFINVIVIIVSSLQYANSIRSLLILKFYLLRAYCKFCYNQFTC